MGHDYKAVQWSPFKRLYDAALALGVLSFIGVFVAASILASPVEAGGREAAAPIQLLIRATGAAGFGLLTLILAIGPLARLTRTAAPLLFNRRHLGVACFLIALAHGSLVTLWYHGFSDLNPLVSLLVSNPRYDSIRGFPFESLGLAALLILFVMAATSHDFWNATLGPRLWKSVHMAVYPAYALLLAHIFLGAIQNETSPLYPLLAGGAAALVAGLHLTAGLKENAIPRSVARTGEWIRVGPPHDIPDGRARIVTPPRGERIAVFRDGARIHAISNVCRHQGGPLGEGRIIDGCVTCPWHGFQYRPSDGCSPPPYSEKIATYRTRLVDGEIEVEPDPLPPGTPVDATTLPEGRR
ncbi:Rieske 2Fe-2S domain-containing protein [bacterium]|nr:Rieske 2Fe-2S domain-containing protein [bacterium]